MVLKLTCVSWGLVNSVPYCVLGYLWFCQGVKMAAEPEAKKSRVEEIK